MFAQITLIPKEASAHAFEVDALFGFIFAVVAFFSILIAVLLIVFAIIFRRRPSDRVPPRIVGSLRLEMFWILTPFAITLVMYFWATSVYFRAARPPEDAEEVYVVGKQWMWKIQHTGGQREINTLHVPIHQPIKLILTSEDVIHSFYVPEFRLKQDAVPGRYTYMWFNASEPGTYHLFCAEYCGTGHSLMVGTVIVMEQEDYQRWLGEQAEGSMALEGRKLFRQFQCVACHSADAHARGPVLEGLYRRTVTLQDGSKVFADEGYIRESILKPEAKIVAGYQPIMPTFQGQMTEEQVLQLIAFIKSLQSGDTPRRVEESEPPQAKPPALKPGENQK
jgi:cytochrome c oxidase subunit II